jgi:hypothetical protein
VATFHALGCMLHFYLDDWLPVPLDPQGTVSGGLGCEPRQLSSSWICHRTLSLLGVGFRTTEGLMSPPQDRTDKIQFLVWWLCPRSSPGQEISSAPWPSQLSDGSPVYAPLQLLLFQWCPFSCVLDQSVPNPGTAWSRTGIYWLRRRVSLTPSSEILIFMDTTLYGWGAHVCKGICP